MVAVESDTVVHTTDLTEEELKLMGTEQVPTDNGLVYSIMLLNGAGVLFPWNSFLSAPDYFTSLYKDDYMSWISVAYSVPNLLALVVLVLIGNKVPMLVKTIPTYLACFVVLILVPVLGFIGVSYNVGYWTILVLVCVMAVASSILQGGIFGLAGMLPSNIIQAVMSGNGLSSVIVIGLRIICKLTIEANANTPEERQRALLLSTAVYFFVSAAFMLVCVVSFVFVLRTKYVLYYINKSKQQVVTQDAVVNDMVKYDSYQNVERASDSVSVIAVFRKIWLMAFCVFFVFAVTFPIFPGICFSIPTAFPNTKWAEWYPIVIVAVFSMGDFIGRTLPRWVILFTPNTLVIPVLLRSVFILLFIFCLAPRVFVHDAIPLTMMGLLALSNGFFSSLPMMFAPGKVLDHERQTAGTMMTLFLVGGIMVGSNFGRLLGFLLSA